MTKAERFQVIADAWEAGNLCHPSPAITDFVAVNHPLIARALHLEEMYQKAVRENNTTCGGCGEFQSGDPPIGWCNSDAKGKHKILVLIDPTELQELTGQAR